MTKKRILLITLTIICSVKVFSQIETNNKKNSLEFSAGYTSGALKNLDLAPVARYDYSGMVYKLNYARRNKRQNIFEIGLNFLPRTGLKTERLPNFNTEILKAGVGFSYLKQLYSKNSLSIHLGLHSQSKIATFFNNSDYFDLHQEFGIASRFGYQLNKKQYLSSQITIPFVLGRVTSLNGGLYSFNRYQSVLWNLKYGYTLSDHFDIKATYQFNYNRLQIPIAYRELKHQLNLGIIYKF